VQKILIAVDKHNELLRPFYESLGVGSSDFAHFTQPLAIVAG
jgi:hypothetical protein